MRATKCKILCVWARESVREWGRNKVLEWGWVWERTYEREWVRYGAWGMILHNIRLREYEWEIDRECTREGEWVCKRASEIVRNLCDAN